MIFRRSVNDRAESPDEGTGADEVPTTSDHDATEVQPAPDESTSEPEGAEAVVETEAAQGPAPEGSADETAVVAAPAAAETEATTEATAEGDPEATAVRGPAEDPAEVEITEEPEPVPVKKRRRGRKVLLGVGIGIVVLAGAYVGAAWYLGDKVPQSTTVAGVDVSGLTAEEAVEVLETQLADVVSGPIPIGMGETSSTIDPAEAGLSFDAAATVDRFTGFTLEPQVVLGHVFGLGAREPVVTVDDDDLTAAVETAATDLNLAPVDGVIAFADGAASVTTEPADGMEVDVPAAAEMIAEDWLTGERPFELPSTTTTPQIDDAAIAAAMTEIVEPLLSAPVTVQLNDAEASLEPALLAAAATLTPDASGLTLAIDGQVLADHIAETVPSVGETARDAQIVLQDGAPAIIPAVTGTGLDPEQLASVVSQAAVATGDARVAVAELAATEPEFTTADAEALGVVEIVGEYSTPYPYDPVRTQNLVNGTAHINGTLVRPGEVFSLIEALGPITRENGYVSSSVVEGGFVTDAMGGGLSQVSTTTFNAAFEAGMEDIEHKPHSRWFERYPPGREATMYAPSLDMKWGNNTPYGVLVQAWVGDDGRVHVRLWSTTYWDVDIRSSEKYAYTSPRTVYNESDTCEPESGGASGFSIDISRTISLDGEVNSEYSRDYTWKYSPWNRVVCGAPPSADAETEDQEED